MAQVRELVTELGTEGLTYCCGAVGWGGRRGGERGSCNQPGTTGQRGREGTGGIGEGGRGPEGTGGDGRGRGGPDPYLGSGRTTFLLARAAGAALLFSMAIR